MSGAGGLAAAAACTGYQPLTPHQLLTLTHDTRVRVAGFGDEFMFTDLHIQVPGEWLLTQADPRPDLVQARLKVHWLDGEELCAGRLFCPASKISLYV
jgi:hypothetical protein